MKKRFLLIKRPLACAAIFSLMLPTIVGCIEPSRGQEVARLPDAQSVLPTITSFAVSTPGVVPPTTQTATVQPSPTAVVQAAPTFVPTQAPAPTHAEVIYGGGEGLHLRAAPNQNKIATFLKGSVLTIRGTPRDDAGFRWWPVEIAPGWVAEGSSDVAQPRWLVPAQGDAVNIGQEVQVVYDGGDGLNLRGAPGASSQKIATLLKPSSAVVVDGPQTVNGVRWWAIKVPPGWIAEGAVDQTQPRWLRFVAP